MGVDRGGEPAWLARQVLAALAFALTACSPSTAPAKDESAAAGDFTAVQISTTDPEGLMRQWAVPTPRVNLTAARQMRRNQPIFTFIIFKGCRRDAAGACNVVARFEVFDPTGKPYNPPQDAEVWVAKPAPPVGVYQLSVGALGIGIEDGEPLGRYTVRATVTDKVSGVSLRTEQALTAVAD
jgi:hypothetical protein